MDVLQRRGVLADADGVNEFKNMKDMVNRGQTFQETLESGRLGIEGVDDVELINQIGVFEAFAARLIGANLASSLARRLGFTGGEIAVPAAGAQAAQAILSRMPQNRAWETLTEAVKDPRLMADLLAQAETLAEKERLARSRRLKAILTTAGGRALADILEPSKYRGSPTTADRDPEAVRRTIRDVPPGQTLQGQQRRPVAPPARQVAPTPQAAPRPQRPPAAPQSNLQQSRRQFAELFPTDITSGIIRSQN
jgi:hypothetical protein